MFGLKSSPSHSDPWPLKFKRHSFDAYCYNTLRCSVIYDRFQFSTKVEEPSGPPPVEDYRSRWSGTNIIGDEFPGPVKIDWVSSDGVEHNTQVDLSEIFADRLVRHNVPRQDVAESWLAAKSVNPVPVDILMEVNDRMVSIYMKALVFTKEPQIPENPRSNGRADLVLSWTHTY